jgi:fibronectin type 3 domain-containing protein
MKRIGITFLAFLALFSCVNQTGTIVREVPTPSIDTVSQGVSTDYRRIDWRTDTSEISRFEIYRSSAEEGTYELLATVDALPVVNSFYDSVTTNSVYYYKIAAIDQKGRLSKLSASKHGFICSIPTSLVLRLEQHVDHIALFWSSPRDTGEYAVYRSSKACTTGMTMIGKTALTEFRDSVTSAGAFFYTISALDGDGHDVVISNCVWGSLRELATPSNCRISNEGVPHTVSLQWDVVPGASGYIIYRSSTYCPNADEEYIRTKSPYYLDSINKGGYYYYAVAAVDNADRVSVMSLCLRGVIGLLPSPENVAASYDEHPSVIVLSWNALAAAHHYVIYRSLGSCSSKMEKIDSTTTSIVYNDSVLTSDTCSYIVAGVDSQGIEGMPSGCVHGRVKLLPAPANIKATNGLYVNKIRVSWDSVAGANGYIYYKGTSNVASLAVPVDTVTSLFDFDSVATSSLYYYWVAARDRLGPGKRSDYVWGRTYIPPILSITSFTDSTVTFSWETDTTSTEWKYLYRYSYDDEDYQCFDSTTGFTYTYTLPDYKFYDYYILAKTAVDQGTFGNSVYQPKRPPTPKGLVATGAENGVLLQWNRVAEGRFQYQIFRSDSASDSTGYLDDVSDTIYFDYSATKSRYYYQILADNRGVHSMLSEAVVGGIVIPPGAASMPKKKNERNRIIPQ